MTRNDFLDARYRISFVAGINQRYHQRVTNSWSRWDRGIKIVVALLAMLSLVLAIVTPLYEDWNAFSISVAAFAAIVLNIVPVGDWQRDHVDLFRRWTDLREEIDVLETDVKGKVTDELISRLQSLEAKVHRITGSEPLCNREILRECEREERLSRGESVVDGVSQ